MMNTYRSRPVAVLLGLALLASACSSDGTDGNADNNAAVETETTAAITIPPATTPPTTDGGVDEADGPDEAEGGSPASTNAPTTQAPGQVEPEPTPNVVDSPAILTAYLGVLDLPAVGVGLLAGVSGCEQQPLDEGMPVVLSHRVEEATLEPSDFAVTTAGGAAMTPTCATLEPATDDDELQTVLLTGPLGSSDDLPAEVAVVGELLAIDGTVLTGIATDTINTFETGPRLVLARLDPADEQCAALGSSHEIQMTWEGGVSGPRGAEPGPAELEGLTLIDVDGGSHPLLGFDDLGDGDNYLVACAPPAVEPATLEARQGTLYDPTNNPNPTTAVEVETRRSATDAGSEE